MGSHPLGQKILAPRSLEAPGGHPFQLFLEGDSRAVRGPGRSSQGDLGWGGGWRGGDRPRCERQPQVPPTEAQRPLLTTFGPAGPASGSVPEEGPGWPRLGLVSSGSQSICRTSRLAGPLEPASELSHVEGEGQRGRASPWGVTQAVLSPRLYTRRSLPCFSPWGLLPGLPYPPPAPLLPQRTSVPPGASGL